jgi:hypothetical protein
MAGSIDPRCETVRGTHWPNPGRVVDWSSRRGNHLGQRFQQAASTGRTYGCKRSDQTVKPLVPRGPSTYGSWLSPGRRGGEQSIPHARLDGLLRCARNDPEGACHVLCVIARECEASSTLRLLGSSADASGILDRPVPATPRLRRGSAVLARRNFSEGGEPGDDQEWLFDR